MPFFTASVGAVLYINGLLIYTFYQNLATSPNTANVVYIDTRASPLVDIHAEQKYITIEFSGALTSLAFYVSPKHLLRVELGCIMMLPHYNGCRELCRFERA